jgi:hypothetical protein
MPLDASIYSQLSGAQPQPAAQPASPLATASGVIGLQNEMQRGDLLGLAKQQAQVGLDTSKFDLAAKQIGMVAQSIASYVNKPDLSTKDLYGEIMNLRAMGGLDDSHAMAAYAEIGNLPDSPDARKQYLLQKAQYMATAQSALDTMRGTPQFVNTGGSIAPMSVSPNFVKPLGAPIPNTLTPGEKVARVPSVGPDGQPLSVPIGAINDAQGNPLPAAGAQPPTTPTRNAPRAVVRSPLAAPAVPASPQPALPPGAMATGLAPGEADRMQKSTQSYQDLANDVGSPTGVPQRIYMLQQAANALKGTNTGLGTEARQKIQSYIAALPGGIGKWAGDPGELKDYDLANKFLTAYQLNQPGAVRSDAGLATSGAANPNVHMNPDAAREVVASNIGLERMKQAQIAAFKASGQNPSTFTDWSDGFQKNIDPRAFSLDMMPAADRRKLLSGLKGDALKKFRDSVRTAVATKTLDPTALTANPDGQ